MQARRNPPFPDTTRTRVYLITLQLLFVAILVKPLLQTLPITRLQGILLTVLAILTVTLLVAPRRLLTMPWFGLGVPSIPPMRTKLLLPREIPKSVVGMVPG